MLVTLIPIDQPMIPCEAKIGLRHDPLIKAIADETLRKLHDFSAQGLVNTLWGFATLVIKGEESSQGW